MTPQQLYSEAVVQNQNLKNIQSNLRTTLDEVEKAMAINNDLLTHLSNLPNVVAAPVAKPVKMSLQQLMHQLITSGSYNYSQTTGNEVYDHAKASIHTRKYVEEVLLLEIEPGDELTLYEFRNKDVVFYTQDSYFGDLHDETGKAAATYLPGFTRTVLVFYVEPGALATTRNGKEFAPIDSLQSIDSTKELADYLLGEKTISGKFPYPAAV